MASNLMTFSSVQFLFSFYYRTPQRYFIYYDKSDQLAAFDNKWSAIAHLGSGTAAGARNCASPAHWSQCKSPRTSPPTATAASSATAAAVTATNGGLRSNGKPSGGVHAAPCRSLAVVTHFGTFDGHAKWLRCRALLESEGGGDR